MSSNKTEYEIIWWIQGGSDLRIVEGSDSITQEGELTEDMALTVLENSLDDFSTKFANEHYLIEAGVWDFGVKEVLERKEIEARKKEAKSREIDWVKMWDDAKYMHRTGLSKTYLKRERICPDCGGELLKAHCPQPDHIVYTCLQCSAMFKDKGNKTSWKCREW